MTTNYDIARPRYKKLLLQFGKTSDEIDNYLKSMNINDIREEYKKYFAKAVRHNEKLNKKNKI